MRKLYCLQEVRLSLLDTISQVKWIQKTGKAIIPKDLSIAVPEGTYAKIALRSVLAWKHSIMLARERLMLITEDLLV